MLRRELCEVPYCAINDNPAIFWCRVLDDLLDCDLLLWHGACVANDRYGVEVGKINSEGLSLATSVITYWSAFGIMWSCWLVSTSSRQRRPKSGALFGCGEQLGDGDRHRDAGKFAEQPSEPLC